MMIARITTVTTRTVMIITIATITTSIPTTIIPMLTSMGTRTIITTVPVPQALAFPA